MRTIVFLTITVFLILCGLLIVQAGFFGYATSPKANLTLLQKADETFEKLSPEVNRPQPVLQASSEITDFKANGGKFQYLYLGADDPCTEDPTEGYKFKLQLSSKAAALKKATFSNGGGKGFDNRDPDNPKPFTFISPVAGNVFAMSNREFVLISHRRQLDLGILSWESLGVDSASDGSQTARFRCTILETSTGEAVMEITKSYTVHRKSYLVDCSIRVENLTEDNQDIRFKMLGPLGVERESSRRDMRQVIGAFRDQKDNINTDRKKIGDFDEDKSFEQKQLRGTGRFLWASVVNKYFAAILVPEPEKTEDYCGWLAEKKGCYYNPDGRDNSKDENIAVLFQTAQASLAPAGQSGNTKNYNFKLYLGPKDKRLFDKNELYSSLGFVQTIDFFVCCCPASIIRPLAFGILALMNWLYSFIGNYGVVIIILVFIIRTLIHPLTKKSQVSMSKMGKLGPKMEEIKKKYANNKTELNRQMMALYRQEGASPILGMLPMFVQMPIWIALYTSIYTSIDLRGAAFLPFWITDLSVPDALVRFPAFTVPLLGWNIYSLNLLPILMGVAMYMQQKLMPSQAAGSTNPQVAQQQKIMMFMMPIFLPVVLYTAPSGLNLYIMASTFAGVIEQKIIRKHTQQKQEAQGKGKVPVTSKTGGKAKKTKPKPFFKKFS